MKTSYFCRSAVVLATLLLAVISLASCGIPQTSSNTPQAQKTKEIELTILNTNDGRGYVEPCG